MKFACKSISKFLKITLIYLILNLFKTNAQRLCVLSVTAGAQRVFNQLIDQLGCKRLEHSLIKWLEMQKYWSSVNNESTNRCALSAGKKGKKMS